MTYVATIVLAFCSIVYELLLGQTLSAFLGNTVLRYSVTIGLYMFSMGIGALFAEGKVIKNPLKSLLAVELGLTIIGGFCVVLMFATSYLSPPGLLFSFIAHSLIIIIGILTGFEIPLLIHVRNLEKAGSDNKVLGIDYLGAFLGTVVFAFFFYPTFGLVPTAFLIGALNGFVGLLLFIRAIKFNVGSVKHLFVAQLIVFFLVVGCLYNAREINRYLIATYLKISTEEVT